MEYPRKEKREPCRAFIGCDPGTQGVAFSVYRDKELQSYVKFKPVLKDIVYFFRHYKDFDLIIEDQYLNLNVHTLKKLVEVRSMIVTVAKLEGAKKIIVVPPQRWQTSVLGVNNKAKREQRKKISCLMAGDIAKKEIQDNDIADAICIGWYGTFKIFYKSK